MLSLIHILTYFRLSCGLRTLIIFHSGNTSFNVSGHVFDVDCRKRIFRTFGIEHGIFRVLVVSAYIILEIICILLSLQSLFISRHCFVTLSIPLFLSRLNHYTELHGAQISWWTVHNLLQLYTCLKHSETFFHVIKFRSWRMKRIRNRVSYNGSLAIECQITT